MSIVMLVINVSIAVIDLVLSILFMQLGRKSDDRNERVMYTAFSITYVIMMFYFIIQAALI